MIARSQAEARSVSRLVRALRAAIVPALLLVLVAATVFAWKVHRYERAINRRLQHSVVYATRPRMQPAGRPVRVARHAVVLNGSPQQARRVAAFDAIPPTLVAAVIAVEDRRFYQHKGVDYVRIASCAVQDTLSFHAVCGGSTLTQQLARTAFLSQRKTLRRKVTEVLLARSLEKRLTKQQIFAMYAREVYLGQRGPTTIKGFQQAAHAYFGKDLRGLTLAQQALLAGMIHAPNYDNPFRYPERAVRRRNVVLDAMVQTGAVTRAQAEAARSEPLDLAALDRDEPASEMQLAVLSF